MPAQNKNSKEDQLPPKKVVEKTLYSWRAAERPFERRSREFWVKTIAIVALFCLILFVVEGIMPVILAISVLFLFYVLSTVEPQDIEYKITNLGVKIADKTTSWEVIKRFWFTQRFNSNLLVFDLEVLPGRLELVIDLKNKEEIRKVLQKQIPEEEATPTGFDKTADWFSKKFSGSQKA